MTCINAMTDTVKSFDSAAELKLFCENSRLLETADLAAGN